MAYNPNDAHILGGTCALCGREKPAGLLTLHGDQWASPLRCTNGKRDTIVACEPRARGRGSGSARRPRGGRFLGRLTSWSTPAGFGYNRRVGLAMLDLFSGSGAASRAAAVRGWRVCRVDNGRGTAADIREDLATWVPPLGARFDLVWASPPCTQLSTAGRARDVDAGLVLVRAALRIIRALEPRWWVLENVHGATRAIGELIGPPVACYGSFYLWGVFPPFAADVPRSKTKLSGRRRAERRAAIPWAISDGLARACERLAAELGGHVGDRPGLERGSSGASSGAGGGLADAGAGDVGGHLGAPS